ncbi:MAG TPA: BamA/TamA family outer membrane protein, partial [Chloroflexota bacterium]
GARTTLELPKFITPWTIEDVSTRFVPKTRIELGARLLDRLQYFKMLSLDASFGYDWKETLTKEHVLDPISFTLVHLAKRTPLFSALLTANPFLRRSYEEQFILGSNYTFTYNDQLETDRKNHLYFKGGIDLSGNLLYAVQSLLAGRKGSPENPFKIFGTTYSQYARFDIDLRHYYHSVDQSTAIATRLVGGVGFAYGNSSTMPYVKQFYIGGANSVRAFNARSLGPGSYKTPDSLAANGFFDEAGDIKLEANVEYRFPLVSILEGALFLDAGNIWLARDDPTRPGATFSSRTFLDEVAVGTGFGIRLDLSFFVLRLDLAFPLRIPYLPEGERWVARKIAFGDPTWRKNNLVFNIAIGYPY